MILLISNQIDGSTCAMMLQLQNGKFYITMGVTVGWAEAIKHIRSLQPFTLDAFGTQLDAGEERVAYSHESFVSSARPVNLHFRWLAFLAAPSVEALNEEAGQRRMLKLSWR